ncbi:MAG: hypothetical protein E7545_01835 [Ruminococcaceae bacterium]|nr:hypothetical protein [Oscillospiraceae bacterium]
MVAILTEANYISTGCKLRLESLINALRKKRIPFCEIFDTCPRDVDGIFVLSADVEWTIHTIKQLNQNGFTPILISDQIENLPGCIYNGVNSDLSASMKNLLEMLKSHNKKCPALYAFNPNSISDNSKETTLQSAASNLFDKIDVFANNGNLEECYNNFINSEKCYDSVICANDFAAITLVKFLEEQHPQKLKELTIISCSNSAISEYYKDKILATNTNHEQYGRAAVYIYEALKKHEYVSSMTIRIVWDFEIKKKETTTTNQKLDFVHSADTFYDDIAVRDLLVVDKFLNTSDTTDRTIIKMLIRNEPLEAIASECFLSINAVKYRIKRLISASGASDKNHLLETITKYAAGF